MAGNSGVFIRCNESDGRACLKELKGLMKPNEKFTLVKRDETIGGLKIFFKHDLTVRNILRQQYLSIEGNRISIHPLTTTLIVHTDISDVSQEFEEILQNGMQHIGSVLKVTKLSLYEDIPDAFSGDFKVVLDVPENEDLCLESLSNNMTLNLPGYDKGFPMTFCCFLCDKDGHTLRRCPMANKAQNLLEVQTATQSSRIDSNEEIKEPTMSSTDRREFEFRIRDPEEVAASAKQKPESLPKRIESWARYFGEEEVRHELMGRPGSSITVKNEYDQCRGIKRSLDEDNETQTSSKYKISRGPVLSTSSADDIEVIYDGDIIGKSDSFKVQRSSNADDVGQVPTSSRPEVSLEVKPELQSTDENDSDSNQGSGLPPPAAVHQTPRRRKPAQPLQIKIPEGIKTIIRQNPGILNEDRLEAFFNHVKKKSCPGIVARQYTENVEVLKAQLQGIKDHYYNTPIIHSADEKYFMKWFENVLTRFDRKPVRKPRN